MMSNTMSDSPVSLQDLSLQNLSLQDLAHSLLVIGFEGLEPGDDTLALIRRGVSGVILFARNVATPRQVAELNRRLKAEARGPLLSSVDQEGGRVARLRAPWTEWPAMRALGDTGDEELAFEVGRTLGEELKASGFDVDYAPVLDVDSNPLNPIIGDRAFGRDPELVGRLGSALAKGLQSVLVSACGKHFPGHGDTSQDSHLDLPVLPHALSVLNERELVPFKAAVDAGVASMMTAHVVFEALDPGLPATMSAKVIDGLLRKQLGFEGVVLSDDLEMKAVHDRFPMRNVVEQALLAGVDGFLCCRRVDLQQEVLGYIVDAVESGRVSLARVVEASGRMRAWAERFACAATDIDPERAERVAGRVEHRRVAERLSNADRLV